MANPDSFEFYVAYPRPVHPEGLNPDELRAPPTMIAGIL